MLMQSIVKGSDVVVPLSRDEAITGITYDSRIVQPGNLFFAVSGHHVDGNTFIRDAISKGARAVITESADVVHAFPLQSVFLTRDIWSTMSTVADNFYGHPSRNLSVIGITGTNGKTTITFFLDHICRVAGIPSGIIGTIQYRYGDIVYPAHNTTPQAIDLHKLLKEMHQRHVQFIFMEVSSHALALQRVKDIRFKGAVFTNVTRDHIDYHKTIKNYFQAKSLLFKSLNIRTPGLKQADKFAIINTDNEYGKRVRLFCHYPVMMYGLHHHQQVTARHIRLSSTGSTFSLVIGHKEYPVQLHLIGEYNVYNVLATTGTALALGIPLPHILKGIQTLPGVPGRVEKVPGPYPFTVIIDYAHTGDALFNVLKALQKVKPKRILTVFGCGGERDRKKRPIMGRIAVQESHHAWITLDNPRGENIQQIVDDILVGVKRTRKHNYTVIIDRRKAIEAAITYAKPGDVVLIAGKGHEQYQILKDKTIKFDDKQVAQEILNS